MLARQFLYYVNGEFRNVVPARTQRRHADYAAGDDVEQFFVELAFFRQAAQIAVRCGDDAHVNAAFQTFADTVRFLFG